MAAPGNKLVSADYSQIELRILAHMAQIDSLRQAFADGLDIHAMTASEMFAVPLGDMTPDVRRRAKAINFGIIYGISAFALPISWAFRAARRRPILMPILKISGHSRLYGSHENRARAQGYVSTLFGRKVHLREITAKIPARRAFAERAAINAPIQGTPPILSAAP